MSKSHFSGKHSSLLWPIAVERIFPTFRSDGEKYFGVRQILRHPRYDPFNTHRNDVAILTLAGRVDLSNDVSPICVDADASETFQDEELWISGWGRGTFINFKSIKTTYPVACTVTIVMTVRS
jgi:hypothetical protein